MNRNLKMIIVIPCLAETGIMETIESLRRNTGFYASAECLIVVNHAQSAYDEIKTINQKLSERIRLSKDRFNDNRVKFFSIEAFNLPDKKAGVGLARKIGMDWAVERFKEAGAFQEGMIICLDGDCTVQENYLAEIERYFTSNKANGCSIYFEHPLDGENVDAIIEYELFLRYYTNALRWCGFPYAFQTVGSSMAVSAPAYEKQGGMNTRKAGEDFYFLNKIIQLQKFGDLTSTTVYPSARKSERVPFGTGREMMEWEVTRQLSAYHPGLFAELKKVFDLVNQFRDCEDPISLLRENKIHPAFITHFNQHGINDEVVVARSNTATLAAFRKRFFVWMNSFRIMKLLNELSSVTFQKKPVLYCADWLWKKISDEQPGADARTMLIQFRRFDQCNPKEVR